MAPVTPRATPNANGGDVGVKSGLLSICVRLKAVQDRRSVSQLDSAKNLRRFLQISSKKFGFTASQSAIKKPFHLVNRKSHALVSVG